MKTMKYLKLALLALVAVFATASCMDDDWKEPNSETSPYGNNSIQETNVVSIAELKAKYGPKQKDAINDTVRIEDGTQIKGIVTGNDIEGNIYSQIAIQDESDKPGIIISVAQGGYWRLRAEPKRLLGCGYRQVQLAWLFVREESV